MPELNAKKIAKIGLIVIGAGVLLNFALVRPTQLYLEKARFEKAAKQLEGIYGQIEAKIGKPDQITRDKSCGYASREFGRGPRSCSVNVEVIYNNRSIDEINAILEKTSDLMGGRAYDALNRTAAFTTISNNTSQTLSLDLSTIRIDGLGCSVDYSYPLTKENTTSYGRATNNNLLISLGCGGDALSEYYHVDKPR